MDSLVFDRDAITNEAYKVRLVDKGIYLPRIPTRIFEKLYQNINDSVELKELLDYAYQADLSEDMLYYKQRSLDTMLSVVIKPFAEEGGFIIFRKNGKSIMLIKEN
ncbi:hypothetical protein [Empedobacter sp.]|uniref:hypothetical protein n=1 Tax=Empedobacter sp. TaxID=1927715 RepID=UPI0028A64926|nr:hypothetical protein [Empedobacter sp.]